MEKTREGGGMRQSGATTGLPAVVGGAEQGDEPRELAAGQQLGHLRRLTPHQPQHHCLPLSHRPLPLGSFSSRLDSQRRASKLQMHKQQKYLHLLKQGPLVTLEILLHQDDSEDMQPDSEGTLSRSRCSGAATVPAMQCNLLVVKLNRWLASSSLACIMWTPQLPMLPPPLRCCCGRSPSMYRSSTSPHRPASLFSGWISMRAT